MPSSRSLAFRRAAFEAAGGYPEWLPIGEDMYLNQRWAELGLRIEPVPSALAWWRVRPTLGATWRQYATPNRQIYICSSSTPPTGGVHGLCGFFAAQTALRRAFR